MKRIYWQDTARAVGILLVVFGHAERGLRAAHLLTDPIWLSIDFAIYTFHMPLFVFLAGLNVPRSLRKREGAFVRSKLLSVLYPYILWSLIQGAVSALLSHFTNARNPGAIWPRSGGARFRPSGFSTCCSSS